MTLVGTSAGLPSRIQQQNAGHFSDAAARRVAEDNVSIGRLYSNERHYTTAADSVLGSRTCSINTLPQWQCSLIIIIIMAGMAVFYVAGYLIEERRIWPVITASPRGRCSK